MKACSRPTWHCFLTDPLHDESEKLQEHGSPPLDKGFSTTTPYRQGGAADARDCA